MGSILHVLRRECLKRHSKISSNYNCFIIKLSQVEKIEIKNYDGSLAYYNR